MNEREQLRELERQIQAAQENNYSTESEQSFDMDFFLTNILNRK
jgi:hypothetical protein